MRGCDVEDCEQPHTAKGLCRRHWFQQHTPKRIWTVDDTKTCPKCGDAKPGVEFYPDKRRGLSTYCKACTRAKSLTDWHSQAPERRLGQHLKRNFGITPEQYQEMHDAQGGLCAICRGPERSRDKSGTVRRLAVDHCHETGRIRGLLCNSCNVSLGRMNDNPERLRAAADYLEAHLVELH